MFVGGGEMFIVLLVCCGVSLGIWLGAYMHLSADLKPAAVTVCGGGENLFISLVFCVVWWWCLSCAPASQSEVQLIM